MIGEVLAGVRSLWRTPGTSLPVVASLALGLGLLGAIFAVVDAVLLRPLPFDDPERLVQVVTAYRSGGWSPDVPAEVGRALLEEPPAGPVALYARRELIRTADGSAEPVVGWEATPGLFRLLGVRPLLGRTLTRADRGADRVLLTHGYWRRAFRSAPDMVGRTLTLDGRAHEVVGVLPPTMDRFPHVSGGSDVWLPMGDGRAARAAGPPSLVARLPAGEAIASYAERIEAREAALRSRHLLPEEASLQVRPLGSWRTTAEGESAIWMVGAAGLLLLVVTILNCVSLLLVDARRRAGEQAVRRALGAGRTRLAREALVRSLVLGAVAGLAAAATTFASVPLVRSVLPEYLLLFSAHDVEVGPRLLLFTGLAGLLAATAVGGAHAAVVLRGLGATGLRSARTPARTARARAGVAVAQVALSAALLVGAGLLSRSMAEMTALDPGFQVAGAWAVEVDVRAAGGDASPPGELLAAGERLRDAVRALPGVAGAALTDAVPPRARLAFPLELEPAGGEPPAGAPPFLPYVSGDASLLEVLDVDVVEGRHLRPSDRGSANVLIDRDLARLLWRDGSPVGRSFRTSAAGDWLTVVGVVDDVKLRGWDERRSDLAMIRPLDAEALEPSLVVVARSRGSGGAPPAGIRRLVGEILPGHPVRELSTLERAMAATREQPRFFTILLLVLTACALFLAGLGLYALMAGNVQARRRELGVRMAVGASPGRLRWSVVGGALLITGAGLVPGLALGWLGSRLLRSQLFGVAAEDPATWVGVALVLLAAAGAASLVPAVRASRVDPAATLRAEG